MDTDTALAGLPEPYVADPGDPCAMIIFGASGDLTKRKLIPALYNLAKDNLLSREFALAGFAKAELTTEQFREKCGEEIQQFATGQVDPDIWHWFARRLYYVSGDFGDPAAFQKLKSVLAEADQEHGTRGNYFYYLATAPGFFSTCIRQLGDAGLTEESNGQWRRVIIEKPFGRDYDSACALNLEITKVLEERQIYRIDHYLGKETVQNILALRFSNGIFEPVWNRNFIDHIQITAAESLGVERRAAFYESAGALRDMIQSHVLQLTSIVAMEAPATFDATPVRNEKIKILQSIRPFTAAAVAQSVVRGQYGPGEVAGKSVPGYRQEPGVKPDSSTETFVALKLLVDNWRWSGVPFFLRTGKRLARPGTEIAIQFKKAPHMVFQGRDVEPNSLVMNIQPDEGISLSFGAKAPGSQMQIRPVTMDFQYKQAFAAGSREAYATLINDCIRGDATLFDRADSVEAAWGLVDPILEAWQTAAPSFPNYPAGSAGPEAAHDLTVAEGRYWRPL